jgi:hypothetical protein
MLIQEIHENDRGLLYTATVMDADGVVDLSAATLIEYRFQKPDGSMLIVPVSLVTDGTDGKIKYSTQTTDFDQPGTWRHQVYIEFGPDEKYSNITKFKVFPNLPLPI